MTKIPPARDRARNVWLQLGFPDAEEHYLKAELVLRLDKAIKSLRLTQRVAARRIRTTQPELSKILGGKFTEVSLERDGALKGVAATIPAVVIRHSYLDMR